ncbi:MULTISPECIES: DHH family phosphoesterase [Atopobiaceae]|uniref:DHH family phosphoesterase n=1 Tax=Atopobiaceae TaxID=1643824 RepID=UPI000B3766A6|nr:MULTISPECIES: DHH family phosphoesterase [Atopobiaceae]MCR8907513.1 DHH family phosphoesterase [Thermophilibacter sp. ET337]OUO32301.1 recombinase RecJ [Olsenella sp. An293]
MGGSCERAGQDAQFDAICRLIEGARTIAICAHTSPDGDALGSGLALAEVIERTWPGREVTGLLADNDVVPRIYEFLPGVERLVRACDYEGAPDLFICVDLSQPSRLADARAVLERSAHVAVLDHHPCDEPCWDAGVVRPDAAAAGVIVTEFARHAGCELTPTMAQNLLCALMTDTGCFQYQNADGEAFRVASALVEAGGSPSEVSLHVYQSDRLSYLHLSATVMGRIVTFERGKIAYSYATSADFAATGVPVAECDGLVDLVRRVDGCEVALFLKEVPGGKVRGNLRAKSARDISAIAREMGGGGHPAAAGFTVEGDIDQALSTVLPKLRALYAEVPASAGL